MGTRLSTAASGQPIAMMNTITALGPFLPALKNLGTSAPDNLEARIDTHTQSRCEAHSHALVISTASTFMPADMSSASTLVLSAFAKVTPSRRHTPTGDVVTVLL